MSFQDEVKNWTQKVEAQSDALLPEVGLECLRSIVEGSEITGSLGQQVDTGALKGSWQLYPISPTELQISTDSPYALQEEDGITYLGKPITQHSAVGGPHSVKLTVAGFSEVVKIVTARVSKA